MMEQIRTHQYKPNHMLIAGEFPQDGGARSIKRELNNCRRAGILTPSSPTLCALLIYISSKLTHFQTYSIYMHTNQTKNFKISPNYSTPTSSVRSSSSPVPPEPPPSFADLPSFQSQTKPHTSSSLFYCPFFDSSPSTILFPAQS